MKEEFFEFSIRQIHEHLVQKEISAQEIVNHCLEKISSQEQNLNAFITQTPEIAAQTAKQIDEDIANGKEIPLLAGIPCSLKDSIMQAGFPCTAGSRILENYIAPFDATVVKKLAIQKVLFFGKTNTDEFGMGGSTENSSFGPTHNPYDVSRVAGGSSGGAAASVASRETLIALGEDTGGSIRLPASFCGVVGLKPTYGAVSRYGVIPLASSLDQIGPLAKTAEDCETVFQAISGRDPLDSTSANRSYQIVDVSAPLNTLRIGLPKEFFQEGLDTRVEQIIRNALKTLENAGATVEEISLPHTPYALSTYYIINTAEASANLARYDGIRYGKSSLHSAKTLLDTYQQTRGEYLGSEVKRRIMLGTFALSAGYYDAYYLKAQKIRMLIRQDFQRAFGKVDVIMGPVCPFLPFKIGERTRDPLSMYLVDIYTVPVNLAGLPGISLPAGKVENLPVGLQVIGQHFREDLLFAIGKSFEKLQPRVY